MMGPAEGGRISAITGVPGDARVWYLGAASGGVWKSVDSGATFRPVSDSMPVQAIGALAIAPSKPSIVWAGTGEAWAIRDADLMGDGIYKSVDSGATWQHMGLEETGRIGRIIVHPTNPNVVYVCALGRATGEQTEHGVYRTTDGGKTWKLVLTLGGNYGCSGLTLDEKNPKVLFAGMWHVIMHTWAMYSGTHDPKDGVYVTRDAGDTWKQVLDPGLPNPPIGKIDVAVAPSNSKRVYALIQTADQGSVWRSDDGGVKWKVVNYQRPLIGRAGYYIHLMVSPANPDEILLANSSFFQSKDGGKTFAEVPWGGDNHDIWFDPKNANHFGLTNDAGARLTTDHGKTFQSVSLPIAQMYHVAVDNQIPYWVYGNRQDNGTMRGPSTAPEGATATRGIAAGAGRGGRGGRGGANADTTNGRGTRRRSRGADHRRGGTRCRCSERSGCGRRTRGSRRRPRFDRRRLDRRWWRRPWRRWLRWILDVGSRAWRLRVRIHAARSHRCERRLGELLRQRGHALRSSRQARAFGEPVDPHARFAAGQAQVPLPLDATAGDRSVRPRHGVLRLPGRIQDL